MNLRRASTPLCFAFIAATVSLLAGCGKDDARRDADVDQRLAEIEKQYARSGGSARPTKSAAHVRAQIEKLPAQLVAGQEYDLELVLVIDDGWHINANPASFDYLIPTKFSLEKRPGLRMVSVSYPKGEPYRLAAIEKPIVIYEKALRIPFRVAVASGATPGRLAAIGQLTVQACDDKTCLAPSQMPVRFSLEISGG